MLLILFWKLYMCKYLQARKLNRHHKRNVRGRVSRQSLSTRSIKSDLCFSATASDNGGVTPQSRQQHHVPWGAPDAHLLVVVSDAKELTDSRTDPSELLPAVSSWHALETGSILSAARITPCNFAGVALAARVIYTVREAIFCFEQDLPLMLEALASAWRREASA